MSRVAETVAIAFASITLAAPLLAQTTTPSAPVTSAPIVSPPIINRPYQPRSPVLGFGQTAPGRLFANSRYYVQQYQDVQSFGRCAVNIAPQNVATLLDAAPNTSTERTRLQFIGARNRACLPYGYAAPIIFLRGALAEALYRKQPVAFALRSTQSPATQEAGFLAAERARDTARLIDDRRFSSLSNCIVARAPLQVRHLLFSDHGSPDERVALQSVLSAAPGCATNARLSAYGSTTFLRVYLAEAAYRWTMFNASDASATIG